MKTTAILILFFFTALIVGIARDMGEPIVAALAVGFAAAVAIRITSRGKS